VTRRGHEEIELEAGCQQLGLSLAPDARARLIAYLDLVYQWNPTTGLTSIARELAVRLHLLDSLAAVPDLAGLDRLADLGTGAGLPGIPLAIACPQLEITLVESKRRKCSFLRQAIRTLDLGNCGVREGDVRCLERGGGDLGALIARAFLPPSDLAALASRLLPMHGRLIALTGPGADVPAMEASSGGTLFAESVRDLCLPGSTERRRIVVLERRL